MTRRFVRRENDPPDRFQARLTVDAFRHDQAEFAQMGADRVGELGQLADKEVTRPMVHQHRL
ncbi:hypothetical protein, partial [Rhodobacter sediminicola]|uniref:hypothetical protein n=1 Tax=Cereibacter sediminicola TaxID=2584941 RepID=UPI001C92F015